MKILWLTIDRSHRVAQHFDHFRNTVSRFADLDIIKKCPIGDRGQNAWYVSQKLMSGETKIDNVVLDHLKEKSDYDFIFCDAFFAYVHEEWRQFGIPSAIFIEDVHGFVPRKQVEKAKKLGIETIFHRFNYGFHSHHKEAKFDFRCIWLPHSIKVNRYTDEVEKSIGVLHVGVFPKEFYPNRHAAVQLLSDKNYFKLVRRPKDKAGTLRRNKWPIDKDYDNLIQSAWICVTGGSIINAPVQKYIEIPAASTLLLSNWFSDLGMLGFKDEVNMVSYTKENLVNKVEDLLKDKEKIKEISENGRSLILSKHTSEIRSKQFINFICQILGQDLEFNIEPCSYQVNFKGSHTPNEEPEQDETPLKRIVPGTNWKARIQQAGV